MGVRNRILLVMLLKDPLLLLGGRECAVWLEEDSASELNSEAKSVGVVGFFLLVLLLDSKPPVSLSGSGLAIDGMLSLSSTPCVSLSWPKGRDLDFALLVLPGNLRCSIPTGGGGENGSKNGRESWLRGAVRGLGLSLRLALPKLGL